MRKSGQQASVDEYAACLVSPGLSGQGFKNISPVALSHRSMVFVQFIMIWVQKKPRSTLLWPKPVGRHDATRAEGLAWACCINTAAKRCNYCSTDVKSSCFLSFPWLRTWPLRDSRHTGAFLLGMGLDSSPGPFWLFLWQDLVQTEQHQSTLQTPQSSGLQWLLDFSG